MPPLPFLTTRLLLPLALAAAIAASEAGAAEDCLSCHDVGAAEPAHDISDPADVHYVDATADGAATPSGHRRLDVQIDSVDVSGTSADFLFTVHDELGAPVDDLVAGDGRFTLARLLPGAGTGDPTEWQNLMAGVPEPFTDAGGSFSFLGSGQYRYVSAYDPQATPVGAGETLRLVVELSGGGLPASNGWCDFDASLVGPIASCASASITRDIVQTDVCNGCHGPTDDTRLALHDGARTEVEYCVTCHNPSGATDMTVLTHKIHMGANLVNGFSNYSHVRYTRALDDCASCHTGGGVDEGNWSTVPTRAACGACHDAVDWATGLNHAGGPQTSDAACASCHPQSGPASSFIAPVETVHLGAARASEAAAYRGGANGFALSALYASGPDTLTLDFSVTRAASKMLLESAPEWTAAGGASRLSITLGWTAAEYTNEGSGRALAQPVPLDALDVGGFVAPLGGGDYRIVTSRPPGASGTVTVALEGHPAADLDGDGTYSDRIPVASAHAHVDVDGAPVEPRREVVDASLCNGCHDSGGAGITHHGQNRTNDVTTCAVCHNPDATDFIWRPPNRLTAADYEREESIDFKRLIHAIHTGRNLANGFAIYRFGSNASDYSSVGFTGSVLNCETCHLPGTYGAAPASITRGSTIHSGDALLDPADDEKLSPVASACSSCHDDSTARDHMIANGASLRHIALLANGLDCSEAGNTVDDASHQGDDVFVRSLGCPPAWPDGSPHDACPAPGAATDVCIRDAGDIGGDLVVIDSSSAVMSGGSIGGDLLARGSASITLRGEGWQVDGQPVADGPIAPLSGTLTGQLSAGDPVDVDFARDTTATIALPEPSPTVQRLWGLAGLWLLLARSRRTHRASRD